MDPVALIFSNEGQEVLTELQSPPFVGVVFSCWAIQRM